MNLFNLTYDGAGLNISISWILIVILIMFYIILHTNLFNKVQSKLLKNKQFEISQAQLGIGTNNITLITNQDDRKIAYKLWIELSTRKIGLPIDLNEDVIVELYDSWYNFFSIARELLKEFPISKLDNDDNTDLIEITTELLNNVLRTHLTTWQAKFRKWYNEELENPDNIGKTPQEIQKEYKFYKELSADIIKINNSLKYYQGILYSIAHDKNNIK